MNRDRFSYEGLDAIEQRLVRLCDDIAYIVIQDRTVPRKDETLGRFDFEVADATPYLVTPSTGDPEDELWLDDDMQSEDGEPSSKQIAEAACRWLRDISERCTVGETYRRFRVKAWGPKAYRMVDSGQFVCRNHDADLDLPHEESAPTMPEPDFDKAAVRGAARGIQALGEFYAQWGNIVIGGISQLQGINNSMTARLHKQLQESRDQVDQLVGSVLEYRFNDATAAEVHKADAREVDARTTLARNAIEQVGQAARALLTQQAVPGDLTEVIGVMGQSPELLEALRDPDVRSLMQDPANLGHLAKLLKQAAAQAPQPQKEA